MAAVADHQQADEDPEPANPEHGDAGDVADVEGCERLKERAEVEEDAPHFPPECERREREDEYRELAGQVAQHELVGRLLVVCCHRLRVEPDSTAARGENVSLRMPVRRVNACPC